MESQTEIRTEGLFAALNDCLYRSMASVTYLMMIDMDELIIPHQHKTLTDMLKFLSTTSFNQAGRTVAPSEVSSYSFQNAFFYLQWPDDPTTHHTLPLPALTKVRRNIKLQPPKQRSKFICHPAAVKEVGNHFIWDFIRGKTLNVSPKIGLLHHYRVCQFGGNLFIFFVQSLIY